MKKQIRSSFTPDNLEKQRLELENLQENNLNEASFEERFELVARLGIKVYPSEDLKSRRIKGGVNFHDILETGEQDGFAKKVYGRPYRSRTCDTLIKSTTDLFQGF